MVCRLGLAFCISSETGVHSSTWLEERVKEKQQGVENATKANRPNVIHRTLSTDEVWWSSVRFR